MIAAGCCGRPQNKGDRGPRCQSPGLSELRDARGTAPAASRVLDMPRSRVQEATDVTTRCSAVAPAPMRWDGREVRNGRAWNFATIWASLRTLGCLATVSNPFATGGIHATLVSSAHKACKLTHRNLPKTNAEKQSIMLSQNLWVSIPMPKTS